MKNIWEIRQDMDSSHYSICMGLAPVIGFLPEHDVNVLDPSFKEMAACLREWITTSITTDPFRFDVAIEPADDVLMLTVDEEMTVTHVDRPFSPANMTT